MVNVFHCKVDRLALPTGLAYQGLLNPGLPVNTLVKLVYSYLKVSPGQYLSRAEKPNVRADLDKQPEVRLRFDSDNRDRPCAIRRTG